MHQTRWQIRREVICSRNLSNTARSSASHGGAWKGSNVSKGMESGQTFQASKATQTFFESSQQGLFWKDAHFYDCKLVNISSMKQAKSDHTHWNYLKKIFGFSTADKRGTKCSLLSGCSATSWWGTNRPLGKSKLKQLRLSEKPIAT